MMQLRSSLDIIVSFNAARGKAWGGSTADFSPPFLILCLLSFAFLRFFSSPILLRALTRSLAALSSPAATVEIGSSPRYRSVRKCRNLLSEWESRLWDRRGGSFFFFFFRNGVAIREERWWRDFEEREVGRENWKIVNVSFFFYYCIRRIARYNRWWWEEIFVNDNRFDDKWVK